MADVIMLVRAFVDTYSSLIMSLSMVVLGGAVLLLWFRIYRSHRAMSGLILAAEEAGRARNRRIEQLSEEITRRSETAFGDLFKQLEEERNRINALQRMLIELKEKQYNGSRMMEKSMQSVMLQLSRRMEMFEKQAGFGRENGAPLGQDPGEKDGLLS